MADQPWTPAMMATAMANLTATVQGLATQVAQLTTEMATLTVNVATTTATVNQLVAAGPGNATIAAVKIVEKPTRFDGKNSEKARQFRNAFYV